MFDLHVDGARFALAPLPSGARLNTPVFVNNFSDQLRRLTNRAR
jgi:threonine aldolase